MELGTNLFGDRKFLLKLASARMPYGKYKDTLIVHLPEHYVVWIYRNALPEGELGEMISLMYEIKVNGLEYLLKPLLKV